MSAPIEREKFKLIKVPMTNNTMRASCFLGVIPGPYYVDAGVR